MYANYWLILAAGLGLAILSAVGTALILEWLSKRRDE